MTLLNKNVYKMIQSKGTIAVAGLAIVGLLLHFSIGSINWDLLAWPVNIIVLVVYLAMLLAAFLLRKKLHIVRWAMSYSAALPALLFTGVATVCFGLTCIRETLSFWPFVLLYIWLVTIVGLVTLRQIKSLLSSQRSLLSSQQSLLKIASLLSHLGFVIAVVCATLGNADMQKLYMNVYKGFPTEWMAAEENGKTHNLDIGVQLNSFTLEEYSMPERMPKRYASNINIYQRNGEKHENVEIEVNKPYSVDGWMIYQYGYDEQMGKQSMLSTLELVRDPWLPFAYIGIYMLLAGAVLLFLKSPLTTKKRILYFVTFIAILLVCISLFQHRMQSKTLMPALQSPWFAPHVVIYMFCYTLLGAATLMALFGKFKVCDKLVSSGLAFMTFGMLFGALWAKEAWGHYWSWDPKETWAAATWFLYLAYIHLRLAQPTREKIAAWLLVVAFCCLQMCWWGINYLPTAQGVSIHTYNLN